jgi:hypothetical protein
LPYSIDTSGLIDGWKRRYPPDVFPGIWENVADLINAEELFAPEEVLHELEIGADDLHEWANLHAQLFVPLDEEIQQAVTDVLAARPTWIPTDRSRNMADPFVVAVARVKACPVVSAEAWTNSPLPERVRIPNVCDGLGIRHMTFLEMMRELGWVFSR